MGWNAIATHAKTYGDPNRKRQRANAKRMRFKPTKGEAMLEDAFRLILKNKRLIKSQWGIGPWIVDFFIPGTGAAVEVDGGSHSGIHRKWNDKYRDNDLMKKYHVSVIRVRDSDVRTDAYGVALSIAKLLNLPLVQKII